MPRQFTLGNGIRVLLLPDEHARLVGMAVGVRLPSKEPEGKTGLAHLTEHVLTHATARHPSWPSLAKAFCAVGRGLFGHTSKTNMVFSSFSLPRRSHLLVDHLAEVVTEPYIRVGPLRIEQARVSVELQDEAENTDSVLDALLDRHLFSGDARAESIYGTKESVAAVRTLDVRTLQRTFVGKRLVIAVVGNFRAERIEERIRMRFQSIRRGAPLTEANFASSQKRRNIILRRDVGVSLINCRLGFWTFGLGNHLRIPLGVLNVHLTDYDASSLALAIDAPGKSFSPSSAVFHYRDVGTLWFTFWATVDRLSEVLGVTMDELRRRRREKLSGSALADAKMQVELLTRRKFLDPLATAQFYTELMLENGSPILLEREYLRAVRRVTTYEVLLAARTTFRANRMTAIFSGPTHGLRKRDLGRILRFR